MFLVSAVRAEGPFVAFEGTRGFYHSKGVPDDAIKLLHGVSKDPNGLLKCFAFTPDGDWIFLFGGNGVYTSNTGLPACKKLTDLWKEPVELKCVAFAPTGGWTIFWGGNGNWTEGSVPDDAFKKLEEVVKKGEELRSIAYGPKGAWVLTFGKTGVYYGHIPKDLAQVLKDAIKNHLTVRCVAFTGDDWICLTNNGWWTSQLNLPSTKWIAQQYKEGHPPKWIAFQPETGPHDFEKWAKIIHDEYDGKLAGGYAFEVRQEGKIVASGANGWARAPSEKKHPAVQWTLDTKMGVASVSKTVTTVALLRLWEETNHSFSIDAPFWPHIKAVCPEADADVKRITLRQLLTHRSGFDSKLDAQSPEDLQKVLIAPLAHKPGEVYQYENVNFYICRVVLEQIGKVQYTPYVKEHVLRPMGITDMETHFQAVTPTCGYQKHGGKRPGFPFDWQMESSSGAAGWYGSVTDLGKFLEGLRDHLVLDPTTTETMFKGGLGWDASDPYWMKNGGWFWDEGPGGRAGELHSVITLFPDDVDAVILCNCNPPTSVEDLVVRAWRESR